MHREGAKVILVDVPSAKEDADKLALEINADVILEDITDPKATALIQQYVINKYKGLDILVNNAGITRDKTIAKMSIDQWRSVLNVNLKAVVNLTETFIEKDSMNMQSSQLVIYFRYSRKCWSNKLFSYKSRSYRIYKSNC